MPKYTYIYIYNHTYITTQKHVHTYIHTYICTRPAKKRASLGCPRQGSWERRKMHSSAAPEETAQVFRIPVGY
jgi:hypothetical protein